MSGSEFAIHAKHKSKPRVVICGSMDFFGWMAKVYHVLAEEGVDAVLPEPSSDLIYAQSVADTVKRKASFAHLRRIKNPTTYAVLVLNFDKNDRDAYIGPNTVGEIAVAAAFGKKIFVLNDFPDSVCPELKSWGAVCLHGTLEPLIDDYKSRARQDDQLWLFATG